MLPVQTTWKKNYKTVLPVIIWWKSKQIKNLRLPTQLPAQPKKTWFLPTTLLLPKRDEKKKNSEKNTFFHTTYQLLPIFLPWHFCKTYLLTTKKKRHSNLYLLLYYKLNYITLHSGSTTLLYYYIQIYYFVLYILLLPINYCHVKFSIFYTTEFTKNDEHF